jgi:hypothetical protein
VMNEGRIGSIALVFGFTVEDILFICSLNYNSLAPVNKLLGQFYLL